MRASRNLNLGKGRSVTVTLNVTSPPACSTVSGAWTAVARPDALIAFLSALFGFNPLPLDTANSSLTTSVVDSCHLKFDTQPHDIVVGQAITGTDYDQTGPPVTADVLDANNELVTGSTAPRGARAVDQPRGGDARPALTTEEPRPAASPRSPACR